MRVLVATVTAVSARRPRGRRRERRAGPQRQADGAGAEVGHAGDHDLEPDERRARWSSASRRRPTQRADPGNEGEQDPDRRRSATSSRARQAMTKAKAPPSARLKPFADHDEGRVRAPRHRRARRRERHLHDLQEEQREARRAPDPGRRSRSSRRARASSQPRASSCSRSAARTSSARRRSSTRAAVAPDVRLTAMRRPRACPSYPRSRPGAACSTPT